MRTVWNIVVSIVLVACVVIIYKVATDKGKEEKYTYTITNMVSKDQVVTISTQEGKNLVVDIKGNRYTEGQLSGTFGNTIVFDVGPGEPQRLEVVRKTRLMASDTFQITVHLHPNEAFGE